jgi:putative protein-disulfide isomerase
MVPDWFEADSVGPGLQVSTRNEAMTEGRQAASHARTASKHLLYIADPMCSWCYGFSPVIAQVAENLAGYAPVRVVMGGLRPGETRPSRGKDMQYLRDAWTHVAAASGQPFNEEFFDRESFVYDTEPPSRAVVTIRHVFPQEALGFLERLSKAFYAGNRDITQADVLGDIAAEAGFNRAEFLAAFESQEARTATQQDFAMCQDAGIRGFPTLLAGTDRSETSGAGGEDSGRGYRLITRGFCALDDMAGALEQWAAD